MEIQLLPKNVLKIRSKQGSIGINPSKNDQFNAAILIGDAADASATVENDGIVVINGPGEYEISGIKIAGVRNKSQTVYSLSVDGVECMVGTLQAISDAQQKLKEHNIAVVAALTDVDASFVTNFASNAVLFYGNLADQVVHKLAKENIKSLSKYQATADKLPTELETVLLA